jgi:hypothetical protein
MAPNDPEIEHAVRAYFEALANGHDVEPFATGPYAGITRAVRPRSADVDIRRLAVVERDSRRAVVDLDATLKATVEASYGTLESAIRYGGPVLVLRQDGAWKVADYAISGRLRSESLQLLDETLSEDDLRLRLASIELRRDATVLDASLENRGRTSVVVTEVWRGARDLGRWWWTPLPMVEFPTVHPGETAPLRIGWTERYSLATNELRFVARVGEGDGPRRFAFVFGVVRRPQPRVIPLADEPRARHMSLRTRRALRWAVSAAFLVPLIAHLYRVSAVAFALNGLAILAAVAVWGRRRHPRQIVMGALFGFAMLALAGFLWWYAA